jgi:hypothetical protein
VVLVVVVVLLLLVGEVPRTADQHEHAAVQNTGREGRGGRRGDDDDDNKKINRGE